MTRLEQINEFLETDKKYTSFVSVTLEDAKRVYASFNQAIRQHDLYSKVYVAKRGNVITLERI